MKTESKKKLSILALNGVLICAIATLIVIGATLAIVQHDFSGLILGIGSVVLLILGVGLFGLQCMTQSGYRFLDNSMIFESPFK